MIIEDGATIRVTKGKDILAHLQGDRGATDTFAGTRRAAAVSIVWHLQDETHESDNLRNGS